METSSTGLGPGGLDSWDPLMKEINCYVRAPLESQTTRAPNHQWITCHVSVNHDYGRKGILKPNANKRSNEPSVQNCAFWTVKSLPKGRNFTYLWRSMLLKMAQSVESAWLIPSRDIQARVLLSRFLVGIFSGWSDIVVTIANLSAKTLTDIGSMYGIFNYIYHKIQPNVDRYTIYGSYG